MLIKIYLITKSTTPNTDGAMKSTAPHRLLENINLINLLHQPFSLCQGNNYLLVMLNILIG
jgi:hypothetical protein